MYGIPGQNFDFHPEMRSERILVDIKLEQVPVLEVGNTIVETYCANGTPWTSFVKTFDDPRPLVTYWMSLPGMQAYIAELLHYGVVITQTWVSLWCSKFQIKTEDETVIAPPDGTKLIARTAAGISCGYGVLEVNGKVRFMPVYGNSDLWRPGVDGANPGEEIHLFMATEGQPGEVRLYSEQRLIWTGNGARIEIPVMSIVPRIEVDKSSSASVGTSYDVERLKALDSMLRPNES